MTQKKQDKLEKDSVKFTAYGIKRNLSDWETILGLKKDTLHKKWCLASYDHVVREIKYLILKSSCVGHLVD